MTVALCSVEGCENKHRARGLCGTHLSRVYRLGTVDLPNTFEERFWRRVDKTDTCWLWTGARRHAYGEVWRDNVKLYAHRVSYILTHGLIPDGLCVLHRCDTPLCVRPDHLFLGTQADNVRDMWAKGRGSKPPIKRKRAA